MHNTPIGPNGTDATKPTEIPSISALTYLTISSSITITPSNEREFTNYHRSFPHSTYQSSHTPPYPTQTPTCMTILQMRYPPIRSHHNRPRHTPPRRHEQPIQPLPLIIHHRYRYTLLTNYPRESRTTLALILTNHIHHEIRHIPIPLHQHTLMIPHLRRTKRAPRRAKIYHHNPTKQKIRIYTVPLRRHKTHPRHLITHAHYKPAPTLPPNLLTARAHPHRAPQPQTRQYPTYDTAHSSPPSGSFTIASKRLRNSPINVLLTATVTFSVPTSTTQRSLSKLHT